VPFSGVFLEKTPKNVGFSALFHQKSTFLMKKLRKTPVFRCFSLEKHPKTGFLVLFS